MRVFIISDMEGVAGITKWEQVTGGEALYEEGRRLYTEELNAAVRGAPAAGATDIVGWIAMVRAKAGGSTRWCPRCSIPAASGSCRTSGPSTPRWLEQGCDAALFIGMHAKAGTATGVLSHTVSGTEWRNLYFDGKLVGETGINAALCGAWECPVLLVSGDTATCAEARELLGPGLTTVPMKQGLGRFSARHIPPARVREMIQGGVKIVLADVGAVPPYDPRSWGDLRQPTDVWILRAGRRKFDCGVG